MPEAFQPIAVRAPHENRFLFRMRCAIDLQLLTIVRFLRPRLRGCRGRLLDVGAGESPWRDLLPQDVEYVAVDTISSSAFGMERREGVTYYDGETLPCDDRSFDHVLCTEVLEHVREAPRFLDEIARVLRPGGTLILTVPWSARLHHLPNDYGRFTKFGLNALLERAGFSSVVVEERGNDVAVIANKLIVLLVRLARPANRLNVVWTWPLALLTLAPAFMFLLAAHIALGTGMGSADDPLGYGVTAVRTPADAEPPR